MYQKIIRKFCLFTWNIWEKIGFYLVPKHFYYPIPETTHLESYNFDKEFPITGLSIDDDSMLTLLNKIKLHNNEYKSLYKPTGYESNGDGSILFGMVRMFKPNLIIEIGSGNSTKVSSYAMDMNNKERDSSSSKDKGEIVAIEPYPTSMLKELQEKKDTQIRLIEEPLEAIDDSIFDKLKENDILFIDSTHIIKCGNDVHRLYLQILPKLPPGVIVHIHDIRFPQDYPQEWILNKKYFWNEQYLLHMFLCFNDSFLILFASNYMKMRYYNEFSQSVTGLDEDGWPGSFWIKKKK